MKVYLGTMLIVMGLAISSASAEQKQFTANEALAGYSKDLASVKLYLKGMDEALSWANALLHNKKRPYLYCEPKNVTITVDQSVDIMRRFVANRPEAGEWPVGMTFLIAMEQALPCS